MGLFDRRKARISSPARVHGHERALTASGERVSGKEAERVRRLPQSWQQRSFAYYDALGEIKYASQFYSRMLAPLRLFAAEIDEDGDLVETTNPKAIAALERIQDPGGGRTGLLSSYGRLMFLTGEALLFVSKDANGEEQWEMLSSDELRVQGGTYLRYKAPSLEAEEYRESAAGDEDESAWAPVDDREAVAYRLWQRHPRYSMLADATMQGVLDLCEELVLLTKAVRARARSRLAGSGFLLFDDRLSPMPKTAEPDEDPDVDPFMALLTEAMVSSIINEASASGVVPLTIRVPVPEGMKLADMIHHLQILDPTQLYPETGLRYEVIKRIALGLDMPPEILLGLQDSNHWTAWQIDEQTWKGHGQPKAQQFCDDVTSAYFRPYLRDVEGMGDEAKLYSIGYDATAIINHPDRTSDAKDLYDKRAIGKRALREASGFDEEDAPTEAELAEMVGIAVRDGSLAWYGEPAPRGGNVEVAPGEIASPDSPIPGGDGTGAEVEEDAPSQPSQNGSEPPGAVVGAMVSRIIGASDMALLRAREAAGNRIRSLAKRDEEAMTLIAGARPGNIASILGRDQMRRLRLPAELELMAGADELIADAFRVWGIEDEKVVKQITDMVLRHAVRTLYDKSPRGLPESFGTYITGLITAGA